jgi:hypothetical protein
MQGRSDILHETMLMPSITLTLFTAKASDSYQQLISVSDSIVMGEHWAAQPRS